MEHDTQKGTERTLEENMGHTPRTPTSRLMSAPNRTKIVNSHHRESINNIVELKTTDGIWGTSIVFPKEIPSETVDELMMLKKGDYYEALAYTRDGYAYVDVPVWKKGETYYVEP